MNYRLKSPWLYRLWRWTKRARAWWHRVIRGHPVVPSQMMGDYGCERCNFSTLEKHIGGWF